MMSANVCRIVRELPRDHSSPFTRAIMVKSCGSAISSAVVIHGPNALPVSKSLPFAGPSIPCISMYCSSRAEKSLKTV
jgi:hypothetical protein